MSFNYYEQTDTPGPRLTRSTRAAKEAKNGEEKRVQGLTKSVVKRKRTVEADESEVEFSFTPTHPDKKKARLAAQENEEPPAARSTRSTRAAKPTAGAAPAKATTATKAPSAQSSVGVRTSVPSKASLQEASTVPTDAADQIVASRPRRASIATSPTPETTPSKKRSASSEPSENLETPSTPTPKKPKSAAATPSSAKKSAKATTKSTQSTPSKTQTSPSTPAKARGKKSAAAAVAKADPDPASEPQALVEDSHNDIQEEAPPMLPSPQKPKTTVRELSPVKPSSPALPRVTSPAKSPQRLPTVSVANIVAPNVSGKGTATTSVPLESNPVSYWDFVNVKRGDKLIKRLVSAKADGSRRYTVEEETSLRIVQERFFAEAERLYRPEDVFEPNPANDGLLEGMARYQRIIELLEKENAELETIQRQIQNHLDDLEFGPAPSAPVGRAKTPTKATRGKRTGATPSRSRRGSLAAEHPLDDPTQSEVTEIMMSLPPAETLLSEDEKLFLDEKSALVSQLQLSDFSRLQTKFDSLELMLKQLAYINGTFEEKSIAVSAAMRQIMVPAAASGKPLLSRIPISSPSLSHK